MSPLNITQPLGIWSIMATIRWCPIFPKWDSYQPLSSDSSVFVSKRKGPTPSFNQSTPFEAPHVPRTSESTHRGSFGHPVRCVVKPSTSWDECSVSIWFSYCHPWSHEKTHGKTFRMEKWSGNQDWLALAVRPLALMILAVLLCFPSSDTDIQHRSPVRPIG